MYILYNGTSMVCQGSAVYRKLNVAHRVSLGKENSSMQTQRPSRDSS